MTQSKTPGVKKSGPIGIVYSPWVPQADALAEALAQRVGKLGPAWTRSVLELEDQEELVQQLRLLVTVGGDGTILRAVRVTAPLSVPLLGVNLGRVGFMTELSAAEAPDRIVAYAHGEGWVEERTMVEAQIVPRASGMPEGSAPPQACHGLNDAVVGRTGVARMVHVEVRVDGLPLATYSCDGVVVATATGSTGYALSAGGPILYPESTSLLVKPVSPQLSLDAGLVLPPEAVVDLTVYTNHQAALSVDGYLDLPLAQGDTVRVKRSPYVARFLRTGLRPRFPEALLRRLGSPPRGG
jgi:NAD+ kinase